MKKTRISLVLFYFLSLVNSKRINLSADKRGLFFDYNDYYESGDWKDLKWESPKFLKLVQQSCVIEFSKRGMRNIISKSENNCKDIISYTVDNFKRGKIFHIIEKQKCEAQYGTLCTVHGNVSQILPSSGSKENVLTTGHINPTFNSSIIQYFWEHSNIGCDTIQDANSEQSIWLKKKKILNPREEPADIQVYDVSACDLLNKNVILLYMPYENTIMLFKDSFGDFSYFAALVFALLNVHWFLQEREKNNDSSNIDETVYKGMSNFVYCTVLIAFYYLNGIVFILENEFVFFIFCCVVSAFYGFLSSINIIAPTFIKKRQLAHDSCMYSIVAIFAVLYRTVENPYAIIFVFLFLLHFLLSCFVEMECLIMLANTNEIESKHETNFFRDCFETFEKINSVLIINWLLVFGFFPIFESDLSTIVYVEIGILATYTLCIYKQKKK